MLHLTDLEGATLAEIAKRGDATSYAVAQSFADSPSEFWSGSAGAVYPLIKRLAARGFLAATPGAQGQRRHLTYHVTPAGRAAMEGWLLDADRASGMGFDPLRTRLMHLDLVAPQRRASFLAAVRLYADTKARTQHFAGLPWAQRMHEVWLATRADYLARLGLLAPGAREEAEAKPSAPR